MGAAKKTLDLAKAEFVISEKEAATAKAAQVAADKHWKAKDSAMKKALAAYEKEKKNHLSAVAAYEGAKSAAAKAAAVRNIGHGHLAQKNCAKHASSFKIKYSKKWPHCHNVKCMHGTTKSMQAECLKHKSCTGFSFTHGKSHGSGCLKKCGSREFGGYGRGSHDYWARQ